MALPRHAVCISGMERSFAEMGDNVRQAVIHFFGTAQITWFGNQPANDDWLTIRRLLPMHVIEPQSQCDGPGTPILNETVRWLSCDLRGRAVDCRRSFVQMLCDAEHCERMIRAHEVERGQDFETILKIRADAFWETRFDAPSPPEKNTVYVPLSGGGKGVNDNMAYGDRASMERYLTRMRHVMRAWGVCRNATGRTIQPGAGTTEAYLSWSLKADGLAAKRMKGWLYCKMTPKLVLEQGGKGCHARVRCRTPCASMTAELSTGRSECFNQPCAVVTGPEHRSAGSPRRCGGPSPFDFGLFEQRADLQKTSVCVDVGARQFFHACARAHDQNATAGTPVRAYKCDAPCPWPRTPSGDPLNFSSLDSVPMCILPSEAERMALALHGRCNLSPGSRESPQMAGALSPLNHAIVGSGGGTWPFRVPTLSTPAPRCRWERALPKQPSATAASNTTTA